MERNKHRQIYELLKKEYRLSEDAARRVANNIYFAYGFSKKSIANICYVLNSRGRAIVRTIVGEINDKDLAEKIDKIEKEKNLIKNYPR